MHDAGLIEQSNEGSDSLKPAGGYVQISATVIGLLWWSYPGGPHLDPGRPGRPGPLRAADPTLRLPLVRTKEGQLPGVTPNYSVKELATFCGLPPKRARAALDELLTLGVLAEFSPEHFAFASSLEAVALTSDQRAEFRSWLSDSHQAAPGAFTSPDSDTFVRGEPHRPSSPSSSVLACDASWLKPGQGFSFSGRLSCRWLPGGSAFASGHPVG